MPAKQVQAATKYEGYLSWEYCRDAKGNYSTRNIKLQVEAGQEFVIGDWVECYVTKGGIEQNEKLSDIKGVKYNSSNKKALTLTNKGVAKTKKTGTTTVTMKKGGIDIKLQIQVVKKGSLTKQAKNSQTFQAKMKEAINIAGKKITAKNYEAFFEKLQEAEAINGKVKKVYNGVIGNGSKFTNKVAVPQYMTYERCRIKLASYINDQPTISFNKDSNLVGKPDAALLNATAVTMVSPSTGLIQLKQKVSLTQIMKLNNDTYGSYYFNNSVYEKKYTDLYAKLQQILTDPYTITDSSFALVDVQGDVEYPFDIAVNFNSDRATLTLVDGEQLPSGTYILNDYAKKYIGDFTVTIP